MNLIDEARRYLRQTEEAQSANGRIDRETLPAHFTPAI
jgi:hypothetical protein